MDDAFLATLRCPIDPARQATLARDGQQLDCSGCHVKFPIKQGIPILLADEAEMPSWCKEMSALPCRRKAERRR